MEIAPFPYNESARLAALRHLGVLDTAAEDQFDCLVRAAALACDVPISLISLIDADRQWFKANVGLEGATQTHRDAAFCAHAILEDGVFEVPNAELDARFADNPLVAGSPDIRFYAGATLVLSTGEHIGTLCVIDRQARQLTPTQREILANLGRAAVKALEARKTALSFVENESRFRALAEASPVGIYATDVNGACTYTNERWQEIYGLTAQDSFGNGWADTLHPQDKDKVFAEWQRTAQLLIEFDMEFRLQHKSGEVRYVHSTARQVLAANGTRIGFVGTVEDVSDRVLQQKAIADAALRMRLATDSGQIGVWDYDHGSNTLVWDDWMYKLYGRTPKAQAGNYDLWSSSLHPEDRTHAEASLHKALDSGQDFQAEFRVVWPDSSVHHLKAYAHVQRNELGQATRLLGVNWDITEQRQLTQALSNERELLQVTLNSIGDSVITTDATGHVQWLNPVADRLTGWTHAEAKGRPLTQVFHIVNEQTRAPTENPVATCIKQGKIVGLANHTVLISRNGEEFGIEDSAAPIRDANGDIRGVVLVFHDVTEQRRLSDEMSRRATHDELTGLVNRAEFEARLSRLLQKSHYDDSGHALMFIDLDQFKLVNDACGHTAGDLLLQQVSKLMGDAVRSRDTLARLGGDEFGVLLDHCTAEQAQRVAQQICDRMQEFRFIHDGKRFRIGASIGLVSVTKNFATTAAVMQAADTSCYAAKEAGRNRVHVWFENDLAMRARHGEMQWTVRIEQALDESNFALYAQRIQALDGSAHGMHAEVLIRMVEPDGNVILPGAFLPAAERFHLASRIDKWVLRKATDWLSSLQDLHSVQTLCINLSGQSIGDRAFHRHAIELFDILGADICKRVCLEITETSAITNLADAGGFIDEMRKLGVRIALDDFGSGASSFGYLKTLTVDLIKIDGQFIKDLPEDALDDSAVRCFVDVARVVGVKTVAEYVEREEVLVRIKELGINYAQGFYLHKPCPISEIFDLQVG